MMNLSVAVADGAIGREEIEVADLAREPAIVGRLVGLDLCVPEPPLASPVPPEGRLDLAFKGGDLGGTVPVDRE
jgi:hypothetical protein